MKFEHTWEKVLSGEKTQTRRLMKPGEFAGHSWGGWIPDINAHNAKFGDLWDLNNPYRTRNYGTCVFHRGNFVKWQIGCTYAVQPTRTAKGIARIRITDIRQEDVRNISEKDRRAEGFGNITDFIQTWAKMYDKPYVKKFVNPDWSFELMERPAERYQAWVLTFELIKETVQV